MLAALGAVENHPPAIRRDRRTQILLTLGELFQVAAVQIDSPDVLLATSVDLGEDNEATRVRDGRVKEIRGPVVAGEAQGIRSVRAHLPKVTASVSLGGIDDFPLRRPCNTGRAVVVLVPGAQGPGFRLLARRGDLEGRKKLELQCQQRLCVRTRPDFLIPRKVMGDLPDFASVK